MKQSKGTINSNELRHRAEQMAQWLIANPFKDFDAQKLLHELQVHQVELEMQNAELKHAHLEADGALRRANTLNEKLERLSQDSDISRESSEAALRIKSEILAKLTGEMERPLQVIAEMLDQIGEAGVNAAQAKRLKRIDTASKQLVKIMAAAHAPRAKKTATRPGKSK